MVTSNDRITVDERRESTQSRQTHPRDVEEMSVPNSYRKKESFQVSGTEMAVTLIAVLMGTGILTLPRVLSERMDTPDGWLSVIISGLLFMILVFLYVRLQRHFPGKT